MKSIAKAAREYAKWAKKNLVISAFYIVLCDTKQNNEMTKQILYDKELF